MPSLKKGQRLFNRRYELIEQLGVGGMGVVWRSRDHTEHTQVALKFLPTVLVLQEREMDRLREEVRAGKGLRHDNIVATYGLEVEDGIAAIVMELVEGQTLQALLEAQPRGFFEPAEIADWASDIAAAVDYLHQQAKRIHRDLKPANIIVSHDGAARLMDFGISQRIQEGVTRHSKSGEAPPESSATLSYASPQQLKGDPAATADDIYSFGALLYDLLTGTPPFYRGAPEVVALQIKTEPVTPLMQRRRELVTEGLNASTGQKVPPVLENIVFACLAKKREQRPTRASQVSQAFHSITDTTPPWYKTKTFQAAAFAAVMAWGAWGMMSGPKEVIKEVPKLVEDTAAKEEAVRQKQRADDLEKKHQEAEQKRIAAEAANAKEAAAKTTMLPAPLPKALPVFASPSNATKADPFINSLGMKFVPAVTYQDGKNVLFCIWETRSKDYAAFVKEARHDAGEDWKKMEMRFVREFGSYDVPIGRGEGESAEESSHPVTSVSHDDAVAFCEWLTKKDRASGCIGPQDEYRLPTDMEWSYAVGIGEKETAIFGATASPKEKADEEKRIKDIYPWGEGFTPSAISGNYGDLIAESKVMHNGANIGYKDDGYATTAPVGSFKANALGLYDMGGNLEEWTSSEWESGSNTRVLRGGCWRSTLFLESSQRTDGLGGKRTYNLGFRCALAAGGDAYQEAKAPAADQTKQATTLETHREFTKGPAPPVSSSKTLPSAPVKVQPSSSIPTPAEHMQRQADEIGSMLERARAQLNNR